MTVICVSHKRKGDDFTFGSTLADAAQRATLARLGKVEDLDIIPAGGSLSQAIDRYVDPEDFWVEKLSQAISDEESFGWGESFAEALEHARRYSF